jgi:hypothetical protein
MLHVSLLVYIRMLADPIYLLPSKFITRKIKDYGKYVTTILRPLVVPSNPH